MFKLIMLLPKLLAWAPAILTGFTSLGIVAKILAFSGIGLGFVGPILEAVAKAFGTVIKLFFDGVEKVFFNPTTLIVCGVCLVYGYVQGGHDEKAKAPKPKPAVSQTVKKPPAKTRYVAPPKQIGLWPFS